MERLDRRVSLKMDSKLYEQLEELAQRERRSLNNLILWLLEKAVKEFGPARTT